MIQTIDAALRLSHTRITLRERCGEAYRRRYLLSEKLPPGMAAVCGTAVHRAAQENWRVKLRTGRDAGLAALKDAAAEEFRERVEREGVILTPEEERRGRERSIGLAIDRACALVNVFRERVAPKYRPRATEQKFELDLGANLSAVGYIDLVDDAGRVVDFKTSARPFSQTEVDGSTQLTIYAAGYHSLYGAPPTGLRIVVLQNWAKPLVRTLDTTRDARDFAILAARVNSFLAADQANVFPPAAAGAWWCSRRWCGYHKTCPYVR